MLRRKKVKSVIRNVVSRVGVNTDSTFLFLCQLDMSHFWHSTKRNGCTAKEYYVCHRADELAALHYHNSSIKYALV